MNKVVQMWNCERFTEQFQNISIKLFQSKPTPASQFSAGYKCSFFVYGLNTALFIYYI